ncbi:oxidoreductase family protein [Tamlana sp. 2201CG12-4]|uniref:oxidoreductase family protein n=1 Tax=Tamlana sp. 2201CG12-4 TaxID=3112582 RepID=UPI002DBCC61F|nr:oxidoreductase family protein [Tamlana sp. 2201CG12-4]MEC3908411.1 oxidoreductase family protein [Tamlana sp. 2201CG12-4]
MDKHIESIILNHTKASGIGKQEIIQSLWSGYGKIIRYYLENSQYKSIVAKHIKLPNTSQHPRGWNTDLSHQRKLKSYAIEMTFYRNWSASCKTFCYVPECIHIEDMNHESLILLEDLNDVGFPIRKTSVNLHDMKLCLKWLAHFHACFMGRNPEGLWQTGTYWHLDTRPDELGALSDLPLKNAAALIDETLNKCKYKTFVHGDAKLANFCFSEDEKRVAAVDFQYIGGGCGMKDVAYFMGSCMYEDDCEKHEKALLDYYFDELYNALNVYGKAINYNELEFEWRQLYPIAWTDFHRFIKGWSPGHWKIHSYSERLSRAVIQQLKSPKRYQ